MKFLLAPFAALAFFVLAAAGPRECPAAPFQAKDVAADAKWVVHVDVDAIRDSKVVQKAFQTCPLLKDSGKHFDNLRQHIGIDLRKDLHGVTLYGPDADKQHAVVIVFSTVDQKLLLDKAAHAADHKVTKHGAVEIHSWTMKHYGKTKPAAGAFYKPDVMVFAADASRVAAAIDVLDGKSAGITDSKSPLGGHVYKGTTVLLRAIEIPANTRCPILKQAKSFRVALGENEGKSFYRAKLVMKTSEAAEQLKAIADGFKAMGDLRFSGDADILKLVNGLKASAKDDTVRIRWEASADDVWTALEKLGKKIHEHWMKGGMSKGPCPFCPFANKAAEGKCPPGCQCPACKAKAKAKAESK